MKPNRKNPLLLAAITVAGLGFSASSLHAQTWSGATDNLWTVAGNWNPSGVPAANAAILFDGTGANLNTSFNATSFTLNSLTFTAGQTAQVTINTTFVTPLTFNPGTVVSVAAGDHRFIGTGTSLLERDMLFTGTSGTDTYTFSIAGGASFEIRGRIAGSGTSSSARPYIKSGNGTLTLSGGNGGTNGWINGGFQINEGALRLANTNALGNSGDKVTVVSGAALEFIGGFSAGQINAAHTISGTGIGATGALRNISGNNVFLGSGTGNITLGANTSIGADAGQLSIATNLTDGANTFSLSKVGSGTLVLTGTNTYDGPTSIDGGILVFGNKVSKTAATATAVAAGTVGLGVHDTTATFYSAIEVGLLFNTTLAGFSLDTASGVAIDTTNAGGSFDQTVALTAARALTKTGSGNLVLSQANSYNGLTSVNAGQLVLQGVGTLGSTAAGTTVASGANVALNATTVTGEAINLSGNGTNLFGALQGFAGSSVWNGAVIIGAADTRIGAVAAASLEVSGVIDDGVNDYRVVYRPADSTATVIVSGANTYTGGTSIIGGPVIASSLNKVVLGATSSSFGAPITAANGMLIIGTQTVGGTLRYVGTGETTDRTIQVGANATTPVVGDTGGAVIESNATTTALTFIAPIFNSPTNNTTNASAPSRTLTLGGSNANANTIAGIIQNNQVSGLPTAAVALAKTGAGSWTLTGLSATAASNYTGTTTINEGTLALTTTSPSLTGGLTFGAAAITTPGILDLTSANATFGGALNVSSNSTANEIKIGAAQTLSIGTSGTSIHQIGAVTPAVTGTVTSLNMTGGGTLNVNGATFAVAASSSSTLNQTATLDLTALKATTINVTGNFRISPNTTQNIGGRGTLLLPTPVVADTVATTAITTTAGTFTVGGGGSFTGSFMNTLQLGTGLTKLRANTINVASGSRDLGQIIYGQLGGDLIIRAGDGTSRATLINVGATNGATASFGPTIRMDLAGHDADILVTTLNVGNQARVNNQAYEFNFGVGDNSLASTLDATNVNIGFRVNNASTTTTLTSKVNLSGGTVTFGDVGATGTGVDIGSSTYILAGAAPTVAELNISNGNVNINNGAGGFAVRLGSNQAAGGGTVTASLNLTGGTTTLGGDIVRGLVSPRTTSTVKLSGGTLNMGNNDIGTATELITLNAESGALSNVATINGTGGLTKTTAGTLIVSGTIAYTGDTTVSEGTLRQSSANTANDASTVAIAASGATLDLTYAGTDTVDKLFIGGVQQAAGIYGPTGINIPQITNSSGSGTLTVLSNPPAGYASWASLNGASADRSADHDSDGVSNGVEFFIGGPTGLTTGFTPLPGVNNTLGVLSTTWTKSVNYTGTYSNDFVVETSTTLTGVWATEPSPGTVTISATNVTYTFPAGPVKNFARLKVTGP